MASYVPTPPTIASVDGELMQGVTPLDADELFPTNHSVDMV